MLFMRGGLHIKESNILPAKESVRELVFWGSLCFLLDKNRRCWSKGNFKITVYILPLDSP